jgi:hypothetical protein
VLRVYRVCSDLVGLHDGTLKFLPGLALMPSSGDLTHLVGPRLSAGLVTIFKLAFDEATGVPGGEWNASSLGRDLFNWDFCKFERMMDATLKDGSLEKLTPWVSFKFAAVNIRFARMFVAYTHSGIASVELGPAAMRQANFIGKMKEMGWLAPGRFEGGVGAVFLLQKAAARYHAFLDLMTTTPRGMLCPSEFGRENDCIDAYWSFSTGYRPRVAYSSASRRHLSVRLASPFATECKELILSHRL